MDSQQELIYRLMTEELTRSDVKNVVGSELSDYIKTREFEDAVRKLTAKVFEKFFKMMYNKRGFWKNDVERD